MQCFRKSRFIRIVLPLALISFLPACHQWAPRGTPFAGVQVMRSNGISPTPNRPAIGGVGVWAGNDVRAASTRIEYFDIATLGSPKTDETSTSEILLWTSLVGGVGFAVLVETMEEDLRW